MFYLISIKNFFVQLQSWEGEIAAECDRNPNLTQTNTQLFLSELLCQMRSSSIKNFNSMNIHFFNLNIFKCKSFNPFNGGGFWPNFHWVIRVMTHKSLTPSKGYIWVMAYNTKLKLDLAQIKLDTIMIRNHKVQVVLDRQNQVPWSICYCLTLFFFFEKKIIIYRYFYHISHKFNVW